MRIIRVTSPRAFDCAAADWLCEHARANPQAVLALPTGDTPRGLYAELIARSRSGAVNLDATRIFNLDEYCGLPQSDPHSYAAFLQQHFIAHLGFAPDRVRLLRGDAPDMQQECAAYDAALAQCGGIDACVLGLGVNGHVAFNEPGSPWNLRTHIVQLSNTTRGAHERQAKTSWQIPAWGVTMGIKTILEARHVLLLVAGAHKEAAKLAVYGATADIEWPVTCLIGHSDLTVIEVCEPESR